MEKASSEKKNNEEFSWFLYSQVMQQYEIQMPPQEPRVEHWDLLGLHPVHTTIFGTYELGLLNIPDQLTKQTNNNNKILCRCTATKNIELIAATCVLLAQLLLFAGLGLLAVVLRQGNTLKH